MIQFVCTLICLFVFLPAADAAVLRVSPGGSGDGSTWASASSLSNALVIANDDDQLWIACGSYTDTNTFAVSTDNLGLYGGFTNGMDNFGDRDSDAYPVLLDGQGIRRVITVSATNVTLDGLVITNARHSAIGNGLYAGSVADGLKLLNCTFTHNEPSANHANGGGAAFVSCSVFMSNCLFDANQSIPASHLYEGGGGFYANGADVVIVDCVFSDNGNKDANSRDGNNGGGFYAVNGSLAVTDTVFANNGFYGTGGAYWGGGGGRLNGVNPARFSGCLFKGNYVWSSGEDRNTSGGGLVVHGASAVTIEHCLFEGNYCVANDSQGGAICVTDGNVGVTNCTFVNNWTEDQGGAIHVYGGTLVVENSIFYSNSAAIRGHDISLEPGGSATVSYCRTGGDEGSDWVYDGAAGITLSNVMTDDPLFASATDYHVKSPAGRWNGSIFVTSDPKPFSPCIDAGNSSHSVGDEVAANGGRINIGRYGGTPEASKSTNSAPVVENRSATTNINTATMSGELVDVETIAEVRIYYGTNTSPSFADSYAAVYPPQQTGTVFSAVVVGLLYDTDYYFRCFATNSSGTDWANTTGTFHTGAEPPGGGSHIIHVKADAAGGETGDNWFNAFTSLNDAMSAVNAGTNEIWVAGGTYDDATVTISENCSIYGGFDNTGTQTTRAARNWSLNPVLLDGTATRRSIYINAGSITLDGLVITNGVAPNHGGGIYSSGTALTMANCLLTRNQPASPNANSGGGAYFNGGSVTMSNCSFVANSANGNSQYQDGIGFYASGVTLDIVDCLFSNQFTGTGYYSDGGAFHVQGGSLSVLNTTFARNTVGPGNINNGSGGAVSIAGNAPATFSECLFRNNEVAAATTTESRGGAMSIYNTGAQVVRIDHCTFEDNKGTWGGAICVRDGTVAITNCTFAANYARKISATAQGGAIHVMDGDVTVKNCILWTNVAETEGHDLSLAGGVMTVSYCRAGGDEGTDWIVDNAAGITTDNIITDDPRFASAAGDYHLRSQAGRWDPTMLGGTGDWTNDLDTSLCIDSGEPGAVLTYTNEPAPHGGRVNLGRYGNTVEASKTYAVVPIVTNIGYTVTNNYVTMQGKLVVNDATATIRFYYGFSDWNWEGYVELPGQYALGTLFSSSVGDLEYDTNYYFRAFATNSVGYDFADNVMMFATGSEPPGGGPGIIHVKADAPGSQSGGTWFDACLNMADAMGKVQGSTNEIWAASGIVQSGGTLTIATNVNVYGGFTGTTETNRSERNVSANVSLLDGGGTLRVVEISDGTVLLDGLTISNGHATVGAGIYANGHDSLTLAGCRVVNNYGGNNGCNGDGAYFNGGSVLITNTTFADNSANWGGGSTGYGAGISALNVNLVIVDSLFSSNSLENPIARDGAGGGGMYISGGTLAVANTSFIGNRGNQGHVNTRGGGAAYLTGALTAGFNNCAFIGNVCAAPTYPTRIPSGGALHVAVSSGYTVTLENCSIGYGSAHGDGGAIIARSGDLVLKNSILWTNTTTGGSSAGEEIYVTGASTTVSNQYSAFTGTNSTYVFVAGGTVSWGPGIIVTNPLFASATDLHLQSKYKRFDDATQTFVVDDATSPCIDRGDPADDVGAEPLPNGDRINLGAYGGTWQASLATSDGAGSQLLFR